MSLILLNRGYGVIDVYVSTNVHVCRRYIYIHTHIHTYIHRVCVEVGWMCGGMSIYYTYSLSLSSHTHTHTHTHTHSHERLQEEAQGEEPQVPPRG